MKKSFILSAAALGAASFMMLSGFDSAETAESVMTKYQEASKDLSDTNATVEMKADISVTIPSDEEDLTIDVLGEGTMDMAVSVNPLAAAVDASFSGSAMGMGGDMTVGTYMTTEEDGTITMYSGTDGEWTKMSLPAETAQQIQDAINASNEQAFDMSDYPISFELSDAPADINGTECYQLTAALTWDDVKELCSWSIDKVNESGLLDEVAEDGEDLSASLEELDSMLAMLDPFTTGLVLNIELDIDTETFYPVKMRIDMDGSDWTTLAFVAASYMGLTDEDGTVMDLTIDVNDLYMDYYFDTASDVVIEIPEDVIAAAVEVDAADLADELTGAVEEMTE